MAESKQMRVYLDNSATSWPKPPQVIEAITRFLTDCGASPGRSGHRMAISAAREVFETRELVAKLFNVPNSDRVIFTSNATHSLNIALKGVLQKGDHVITTTFEHNSAIRPLRELEAKGIIEVSVIGCNSSGYFDLEVLKSSIKPNTRLVASIHASNVSGDVLPIEQIGEICKSHNLLFLVDASQSAGIIPVDMQTHNIDMLAFTGHKKLYGPTGIGGLCVANNHILLQPLIQGGTGSQSESEFHPDFYPDRLEAGTLNTVGIVGLKAGVDFILGKGFDNIQAHIQLLTLRFVKGLKTISTIDVQRTAMGSLRVGVVSLNLQGYSPSDLAFALDSEYGIMIRPGLHCAPLAHRALGTFPQGSARFSFGCFNTIAEVDYTLEVLRKLNERKKNTQRS